MSHSVEFHTDLYRRDALELVVRKYEAKARIELTDAGSHVVARLEPLAGGEDPRALRDAFCSDAFALTARKMRELGPGETRNVAPAEPPWGLLAPFTAGMPLALGWTLESLSPIRAGAATLVLRHPEHGTARVAIRRNSGAPIGVAHTDHLDFMLMNGGGGTTRTDGSIGRVLRAFANTLQHKVRTPPDPALVAALRPHVEPSATGGTGEAGAEPVSVVSQIDPDERTLELELDETGISRLALYDAMLPFAERCYVFLSRPEQSRMTVRLRPRQGNTPEGLTALLDEVMAALDRVARNAPPSTATDGHNGLPPLVRSRVDVEKVVEELAAADPATVGLGFVPERGPGHENLRVMTILGTGACNSDCLFCCEKFNPGNRPMPNNDAIRTTILTGAGEFDMLFFASGEPTIHPKLFDYVELAKSVGFTSFGMSSHFRTFADPRFALKTLQAGFEFFDISLHAADPDGQLAVNPIEDGGKSLYEALQGLANIYRLADALGIRISVTQKIVISRLNVDQLEAIFRAGYDRGVRHFILQPVRSIGLAPDRQAKLAISEDEMIPKLNALLEATTGLGATLKPYGFSRSKLFQGEHVEYERNRIKNVMGKAKRPRGKIVLPNRSEPRPTDGRHFVEIRTPDGDCFGFAATPDAPVLDQVLRRSVDLPFGCRMGSCGMCCARILEGEVDQSTQHFLSDEQIRQGYVLLCQGRPRSDVVITTITDDELDPL